MPNPRIDNIGIVVTDMRAAVAFFKEIGFEEEGAATLEGDWVDRVVGLEGVRSDIVLLRTPDGHGKIELTTFQRPAAITPEPKDAPPNAIGMRRIMIAVDDVKELVTRLLQRHGAELMGEIVRYEDIYELCFVRGPDGIIVALAEELRR